MWKNEKEKERKDKTKCEANSERRKVWRVSGSRYVQCSHGNEQLYI